jgi:aromatic ring-cleaving dioxygenase
MLASSGRLHHQPLVPILCQPHPPEKGKRHNLPAPWSFFLCLHPWRAAPIGPHLFPQYQIVFNPDQFPAFVPFLMMNRSGLTVLVHPQTGPSVRRPYLERDVDG